MPAFSHKIKGTFHYISHEIGPESSIHSPVGFAEQIGWKRTSSDFCCESSPLDGRRSTPKGAVRCPPSKRYLQRFVKSRKFENLTGAKHREWMGLSITVMDHSPIPCVKCTSEKYTKNVGTNFDTTGWPISSTLPISVGPEGWDSVADLPG